MLIPALLLAVVTSAQAAPAPDPTAFTVVSLRLGPKWDRALPANRQPGIKDHGQYMTRLTAEGRMVLGGPFLEDPVAGTVSGAMVILATADAAEARRLVEQDPGVTSGLLEIGELRRFVAATGTWRPWATAAR